MNILVVCNYDLYRNLGYSFVHNQIREYAALGHRVRALIPCAMGKLGRNGRRIDKPLLISKADGVEMYDMRFLSLGKYGRKRFNMISALGTARAQWRRILRDFRPDVIHAHTFGLDSEMGTMFKKQLGCPLVVTTHGGDTTIRVNEGKLAELRHYCEKVDVVVAVSKALESRLKCCGTQTEIRTIHNGFILRDAPKDNEKKPHSLIQVCNLIPSKKVDMTLRAFSILKSREPDMSLTIVGHGVLRSELEQLCGQLQISESVQFTGRQSNQEVFDRMCQSEFFVMASKPEGFGIVYLEAMAAGCVVIGTEGEGIADVITHGQNGFLVPADDPEAIAKTIQFCMTHPERAREIALCGQKVAREMTWEKTARQYIALFESIV